MRKRRGPEDPPDDAPLFNLPERGTAESEARIGVAAELAHEKAGNVEPGWKDAAYQALRDYALAHEFIVIEDVSSAFGTPSDADPRAWGHVARLARASGVIESCDPIRDRWGSWKTRWRSKVWSAAAK